MRQEDCIDVFERIPELLHASTNLVLKNSAIIAIDTVIRFELNYVVVRGREGGTTDEGRSFFVPYEDIAYVKIETVLKAGDLKRMYGEASSTAKEAELSGETLNGLKDSQAGTDVMTPAPMASSSMDPAAIAKQNLLDRIRNARTSTLSGIRNSPR